MPIIIASTKVLVRYEAGKRESGRHVWYHTPQGQYALKLGLRGCMRFQKSRWCDADARILQRTETRYRCGTKQLCSVKVGSVIAEVSGERHDAQRSSRSRALHNWGATNISRDSHCFSHFVLSSKNICCSTTQNATCRVFPAKSLLLLLVLCGKVFVAFLASQRNLCRETTRRSCQGVS
jgi:hypothetical protein